MKILRTRKSFQIWRSQIGNQSIGFVPTMGALHSGHLSLVSKAQAENDLGVVSLFVNPTQFGRNEDFKTYPRTLKKDLKVLGESKVNAVFVPQSVSEIYPEGFRQVGVIPRKNLSNILEGKFRPDFFLGVATVVLKLFEIVRPHRAYFGEKDFQQIRVVEALVEDFFLPVQIRRCPTRREPSGLAMSSRNEYLSAMDRQAAAALYQVISKEAKISTARRKLRQLGFQIDYLEAWEANLLRRKATTPCRWLVAVRFKGVRLIDNLLKR